MIKFTNIPTDNADYSPVEKIEMVVGDQSSLPDILEAFEGFLKASGYNWDADMHLDFVADEGILWNNKDVKHEEEKIKFRIVD
jgi:hypothetical protein